MLLIHLVTISNTAVATVHAGQSAANKTADLLRLTPGGGKTEAQQQDKKTTVTELY